MLRLLRRTFSRRGRRRPQPRVPQSGVAESGIHIPSPDGKRGKSVITARVLLLDGTDVSVDVPVSPLDCLKLILAELWIYLHHC